MITGTSASRIRPLVSSLLRPVLAPMRPGNVVMFHIGRCGSTVVGQLLEQHRRIYWASELYNDIFLGWNEQHGGVEAVGEMPDDAIEILKTDMQRALHRYYGFEVKPFHLRLIGYSPESFVQHLDSVGFTHFILLDRKNRLHKIVSSVIAHQDATKYHIGRSSKARKTRVRVDVHDVRIDYDAKPLLDYLSDYDDQVRTLEALLEGRKFLKLAYEEDVQANPKRAYVRICEFLGLPAANAAVTLSRTNPFGVREMVENIGEVENALRGTPYEWMLND